jgi:hypothetical protein
VARPFLAKPRALASLRREFDALAAELRQRLRAEETNGKDPDTRLDSLPHRLVLQLGGVAISFSWVFGRAESVVDGRLLIIEWDGVVARGRGIGTGQTATPVRECVYRPEATGPESWLWRLDDSNGRAFSTSNLAGEWLLGATIAGGRDADCADTPGMTHALREATQPAIN